MVYLHLLSIVVISSGVSAIAPYADGSGGWQAAYARAKQEVAKLSLEEKLNITTFGNGIPSINYPGPGATDGPSGMNGFLGHSAFTAPITAAATFDRKLIFERAVAMGEEAYDAGFVTLQGIMVNHARSQEAGRNFEGFGADPYLSGQFAQQSVKAIQSTKVGALAKHFVLNDQERQRSSTSSNVDQRALREIYLPAFEEAVKAGVIGIMCSYNQINGTYSCANEGTLGTILKGELGFQGWVVSDLFALHDTVNSFSAGADMDSGGTSYPEANEFNYAASGIPAFGSSLQVVIENGTVPLARLDDAVIRVLSSYYHLGLDKYDRPAPVGRYRNVQRNHKEGIREVSAAGTVLLKNVNKALPLRKPSLLAVFGQDAGGKPHGINQITTEVAYVGAGPPPGAVFDLLGTYGGNADGNIVGGYGSGFASLPYLVTPLDALTARAREENTVIQSITDNYDLTNIDLLAAEENDACLVFIGTAAGEEIVIVEGNNGDRNNQSAWFRGDDLVEQVASQCANTIVVVHSAGAILMPWSDNENITAIVWAGYPGQESGNALVDILYGEVNPSGRLPYTIAKRYEDYSAHVDYLPLVFNGTYPDINYSEGLLTDYRHFQANRIAPKYAFGHGLSYTTFAYSQINISPIALSSTRHRLRRATSSKRQSSTPYPDELYNNAYLVTVRVENTGDVAGYEVSQLYLEFEDVGMPFKALKGFERTYLEKGEVKEVGFILRTRDISYWSVEKHAWILPAQITAYVGSSSDDLPVYKSFNL